MDKVSFNDFDSVYQASVAEIWPHWNEEMQTKIARHCVAWSPGRTDFLEYLRVSSVRFYRSYQALVTHGGRSICDVGGFWGVWPVTAKKLGFDVAMTETMKYYGESFSPLFDQIKASGVSIFDYDPFSPTAELTRQFDLVTVMAVLEHYPHSFRVLMENLKKLVDTNGHIFLEAPNIAYWPKRTAMLRGRSPLAELSDIYHSDVPFIGHHHEMTIAELRDLAHASDLKILSEDFYNYSLAHKSKIKLAIRHPVLSAALALSRTSRECIAILCVGNDPA